MTSQGSAQPKDSSEAGPHDNIDKLSLSMIQLSSNTLKSAQLVKNAQMETMVQLHSDAKSGSLQIRPQDIGQNFKISDADQATINKLATLKSYDVYSLRGNLEKLGIEADAEAFEISDELKEKLAVYAQEFTRPLILNVFGDGTGSVSDMENLQQLFRNPDVRLVQARLQIMSTKTGIPVGDIPAFLKNYADLFQSGTYYRHSFAALGPDLERFWQWIGELKAHRETASQGAVANCKKVEDAMTFLCASIQQRLHEFKKGFEVFWGDMSKKSFERMRRQIEGNHAGMGAVLCAVTVKMHDWSKNFPDNDTGGASTRLKYVTSKLEPGLEQLRTAEAEARKTAQL